MMKKFWFSLLLAVLLCTGCVVAAGPHGASIGIAPPLPAVVELEEDPYYVHGDFYYYYNNDRWYYSRSRGAPG